MVSGIFLKVFGSKNSRELKRMSKLVARVNAFEEQMRALSDENLTAKTAEFRQRLEAGATLDDLLPEAFATVREAAHRVIGLRPFDVQIIGGITLHEGRIAEMRTGEGKTLVATLPAYLNCADRERRSPRHRQRLSRAARRRVDGTGVQSTGHDRRRHPVASGRGVQARGLPRRCHLRHEQRVRFRLSARQHGVHAEGQVSARTEFCDRR